MLSSKLSTCHESVSSLKDLNDELNAKVEEANATRSCVEHVVICNRCKYFDVNACDEHLASIAKLNNEVATFNAQLKTCKMDYDKLKFDRDAYTVGRHPSIKVGLGFRKETKNLTSQRTLVLNKEKGKAHMASSSQKNHVYIYDGKFTRHAHNDRCYDHVVLPGYHTSHAMVASSSTSDYGRNRPRRNHAVSHAPRKVCNGSTTVYNTCDTSFVLLCKNAKVVARKLGSKCKGDKTCIWVPKVIVTNLVGPNKLRVGYLKSKLKLPCRFMHWGLKLDYRQRMHKPHDGGEENVHLLRQKQGFPGFDHLWRWEPWQGQRIGKDSHHI
jgi:hypothetical protein